MDISRLKYFDKIVGIFKDGRLTPTSKIAQGTAPHTVSFVEKPGDKQFAAGMTNWYTMVPTIYNADTLGIRPDLIGRPIGSWTELLNPEFRGKASILNIASIGIMDAAMVCEAMGAVRDGGSFYERMGAVECWNSVMDENRYMVRKWNEFIAA